MYYISIVSITWCALHDIFLWALWNKSQETWTKLAQCCRTAWVSDITKDHEQLVVKSYGKLDRIRQNFSGSTALCRSAAGYCRVSPCVKDHIAYVKSLFSCCRDLSSHLSQANGCRMMQALGHEPEPKHLHMLKLHTVYRIMHCRWMMFGLNWSDYSNNTRKLSPPYAAPVNAWIRMVQAPLNLQT